LIPSGKKLAGNRSEVLTVMLFPQYRGYPSSLQYTLHWRY
jgi:hypothetical protein